MPMWFRGARIEEEIKDSQAEYDRNENRVDELIDVGGSRGWTAHRTTHPESCRDIEFIGRSKAEFNTARNKVTLPRKNVGFAQT